MDDAILVNSIISYITNNNCENEPLYLTYNKWSIVSQIVLHKYEEVQWAISFINKVKQTNKDFLKESLNIEN